MMLSESHDEALWEGLGTVVSVQARLAADPHARHFAAELDGWVERLAEAKRAYDPLRWAEVIASSSAESARFRLSDVIDDVLRARRKGTVPPAKRARDLAEWKLPSLGEAACVTEVRACARALSDSGKPAARALGAALEEALSAAERTYAAACAAEAALKPAADRVEALDEELFAVTEELNERIRAYGKAKRLGAVWANRLASDDPAEEGEEDEQVP